MTPCSTVIMVTNTSPGGRKDFAPGSLCLALVPKIRKTWSPFLTPSQKQLDPYLFQTLVGVIII